MKHTVISLILAAVAAVAPVFAQSAQNGKDKDKENAEPASGVRFVCCSPSGAQLPSPLFTKIGKTYKELPITGRMPSRRVKPSNGTIDFYDHDVTAEAGDEKTPNAKKKDMPAPTLTVTVPAEMTGKLLCILVPTDRNNPAKVKQLFVRESDFPKNGVHIINFAGTPLEMKVSKKGDYSDSKVSKIGPYQGRIDKQNSWSSPAGDPGEVYSFILSAQDPKSKTPRRIKASRFALTDSQSMINIVVKDPERESYKLLSIQLGDSAK